MSAFDNDQRRRARGRPWLLALLVPLLAALVVAAGCGSDSDSDSEQAGTDGSTTATTERSPDADRWAEESGYVYAGTEEETEQAREAGANDAGDPVDPPEGLRIGIIQLSGQSATSIAITAAARQIAEMFDYDVEVCDPNFDPQKIPQCATSIVSQQPDVIISVSQNPGPMGSAVSQAAQRGIPWFGTGSASDPAEGFNDYGIDGFALSEVLDEFLFAKMDELSEGDGEQSVFAITAPTVGVASRNSEEQLKRDVDEAGDIRLINHNLDLANAVQDTLNTTRQTLEQNPDLAGMWTLCDFCLPLMAQTVGNVQGGNRTTAIAGQYSSPDSIEGIRKGTIDGVADYAWSLPVWVAMDQVLQNKTRDEEIVQGFDVFGTYPLPFMEPYMITKENALESGPAPIYGPDYETYFTTKWQEEFGIG